MTPHTQTLRRALERLHKAIHGLAQTEDKITLFEASPTKSQRAFEAWCELNNAQTQAAEALATQDQQPKNDSYIWRCERTNNPVGTDTQMVGSTPCDCRGCRGHALATQDQPAPSPEGGWLPIESAPKDGCTEIQIWDEHSHVVFQEEEVARVMYNQVRDDRYHGEGKAWEDRSQETRDQWLRVARAVLAPNGQAAKIGRKINV